MYAFGCAEGTLWILTQMKRKRNLRISFPVDHKTQHQSFPRYILLHFFINPASKQHNRQSRRDHIRNSLR